MPATDRREQGFTLLELLVTIVVLGVLASVVVVAMRGISARGAEAACAADARTLAGAVEVYAATHPNSPAPDEATLVAAGLIHSPSSRFDVTAGSIVASPGSACVESSDDMALVATSTVAGAAGTTVAPGGPGATAAAPPTTVTGSSGGAPTTAAAPSGPTSTSAGAPSESAPVGERSTGPAAKWTSSSSAKADVAADGTVTFGSSGDTWAAQPGGSGSGGAVESFATVVEGSPTYYGVVYGAPTDPNAPLSGVVVAIDVKTKKLVAEVWWQGSRCAKPKESTGLAKGFDPTKPHPIGLVAVPGEHGLVVTGRVDDTTTVTIDLADINSGEACRGFQLGAGSGLVVSGSGRVRFEKTAVA